VLLRSLETFENRNNRLKPILENVRRITILR
ncbi:hypothetical protein CSUI_006531, partial [Cystoisospora suis]